MTVTITHTHSRARTHYRVWDRSKAEGLRSNPPIAELNRELVLVGLPPASVVQYASMGVASGELAGGGGERGAGGGDAPTSTAAIIGGTLACTFVLLCLVTGIKDPPPPSSLSQVLPAPTPAPSTQELPRTLHELSIDDPFC